MTRPDDDPDWMPWDVESARRWALPPEPGVPASAHWCSACDRLEHRGDPLHSSGTAAPLDPPRTCRPATVHPVTVTPVEPVRPAAAAAPAPFTGFWCPECRYLVPSRTAPHPDQFSRPFRTPGCGPAAVYRARVS